MSSNEKPSEKGTDVSIPGVKVIFKKDSSSFLRVAWIVAITVCISVAIYQISDAVIRYFSYPAVINVEMIRQVYLTLPSITFCPGEFLPHLYPDENFKMSWPPNGTDWLNDTQQFHLREYNVTAEIQYADSIHPVSINDTEISTFLGVCRRLSYDHPVRYKGATTFSIFLKSIYEYHFLSLDVSYAYYIPSLGNNYENSLLFMLEDTSVYPLPHIFMYSRGPLEKGKKYRYQLTTTEFKSKSFPNKPCEKDIHSYQRCWDTFVNEEMNKIGQCRMPFIYSENENLSLCSDYETLMKEYKKVMKVYDNAWDSKSSNCLEICDDVQYHLMKLQEINLSQKKDVEFHLDLSENTKQVVTKDFGYSVPQMLSDIGGSLGLFLGCSILTFLEILQIIGLRLRRATR